MAAIPDKINNQADEDRSSDGAVTESHVEEPAEVVEKKVFWSLRKAITGEDPELLFYGEIAESSWYGDDVTPRQLVDDLDALGDIQRLKVRINSPGGDLFAANTIYNILKNHKAKVTCYVDGMAASAATIILMAGDDIVMPRNAALMIHNPSTMAWGDARDLRKVADMLDTARETMLATYVSRTGMDRAKIISMLNSETWLTAKDAVEMGFADRIDEQMLPIAACLNSKSKTLVVNGLKFDARKFENIPEDFAKRIDDQMDKVPSIRVFKDGDNTRFEMWSPFIENGVKEDERLVYGYSTIFDVEDYDGERMTREAIEEALPAYAEDPVIDEVHNYQPVGTAPILQIDDIGLLTGAKVSDDGAWEKVKDGTYKGFSLGGDVLAAKDAVVDGKLVSDITKCRIDAISLCDRPKCPGAVYHLVTNQGGSLVLCIKEGGENKVADEKTGAQSGDQEANKSLMAQFVEWIKGEGKDEMTAALGIDMSIYATKEDFDGIKNSVSGISTKLDEFLAKLDQKAGDDAGAGDGKAAEDAKAAAGAAAQNSGDDFTKVIENLGKTMSSLVTTMEDVSQRTTALEESKGMRKSVDAIGKTGETKGEDLWDGVFPDGMGKASE